MTERLKITRRDFIDGFALSVAAGSSLSPLELLAQDGSNVVSSPYPPARTGLRGNHPGSFEVSHALLSGGSAWPRPGTLTDDVYDLVVVGGGISGLSAAFLYRQRVGPDARILVLDNHDDFGGHAKRNEFEVGGKRLIGYGGSMSIDDPKRVYAGFRAASAGRRNRYRAFLRVLRPQLLQGQKSERRNLFQLGALRCRQRTSRSHSEYGRC